MTKEIIIDGVNVAECYFYYKGECRCELNCIDLYKNKTIVELAQRNPEHNYMECKPSENCYFKQLKRLQEENEGLKKRQITKNGFICDCEQNAKYKQALEEIKNIAELEVMFGENSKAFYPTNIQRILDVINEVLNEQK